VAGADGVAFEAAPGFLEEFPGDASFSRDVKVVSNCCIGRFRGAVGDDHEGGALSIESVFDWFDPAHEEDG